MATGKDSAIYNKGTAVNSYKAFLHELGKHLTKKNIAELKFVCELPGGVEVENSLQLFHALEEDNKISGDEIGLQSLVDLLEAITRRDLVKKVKAFINSRHNEASERPSPVQRAASEEPQKSAPAHKTVEKSSSNDIPSTVSKEPFSTPSKKPSDIRKKNSPQLKLFTPAFFEKPGPAEKKLNKPSETGVGSTEKKGLLSVETSCQFLSSEAQSPSENLSVHPANDKHHYALPEDLNKANIPYSIPGQYYKMDNDPKGICLVISNEKFEPQSNLSDRKGSHVDVQSIEKVFKNFGFLVRVRRDVKVGNGNSEKPSMLQIFSDLAKEDHSQFNILVVFILSHGCETGIYGVDGQCLDMNEILLPFKTCTSLSGKPKIFFGQFCRGEKEEKPCTDFGPQNHRFTLEDPKEAHFYIGYATPPGYVSFRSETHGSWFISKLCRVFSSHHHQRDLKAMMTLVNKEVTDAYTKEGCKQVPFTVSTLSKDVRLYSKDV